MKGNILASSAMVHFLTDLTCIWLMNHLSGGTGTWWYLGFLLYNFCAFALQLPVGMALDAMCEGKTAAEASRRCLTVSASGCVLLAGCTLLGIRGVVMILCAGLANAFFHIGCGADLLLLYDGVRTDASAESRKKEFIGRHGAQGVFVPAGGFGLFAGALLPFHQGIRFALGAMLLLSFLILLVIAKKPLAETDAPLYGTAGLQKREASSSFETMFSGACMFLAVMLHSATELSFSISWKNGFVLGLAVALCALFGKMAGGLFSDRFEIRRVLPLSLAVASGLLLFLDVPAAGMAGLFAYHMSMPLFFSGMYDLFPGKYAFAYGLVKTAIFAGYVPVYAGMNGFLSRPVMAALLCALSLVMALLQGAAIRKRTAAVTAVLFFVCVLFVTPMQAKADVIFGGPETNDFYNEHGKEIRDVEGYKKCYSKTDVKGYEEPGDRKEAIELQAGVHYSVSAVYRDPDGTWWGLMYGGEGGGHGGEQTEYWFALDDLYLAFDTDDFETYYEDEIYRDEKTSLRPGKKILFYTYPCSGEIAYEKEILKSDAEYYTTRRFFRDMEGRLWGRVKMGMNSELYYWVCLDAPSKQITSEEDVYAVEIPARTLVEEVVLTGKDRNGRSEKGQSYSGSDVSRLPMRVIVIAVCVLALVWIGAVVIVVLIIRKKGRK